MTSTSGRSVWTWGALGAAAAGLLPFLPGLRASGALSHVQIPGSIWGFDGGLFMPLAWATRFLGHEWLVNLALHAGACAMLFAAIVSLGRSFGKIRWDAMWACGLAAAALFAVNPLRGALVLSDAGRPVLLSTIFMLGSLLAYLEYRETEGRPAWIWTTLGTYALACLAWTGAAAFPVALAALDYWKPGRSGPARWPNPFAAPNWAGVSFGVLAYVAVVYGMNGHYLAAPPRLPHWAAGFELSRMGAGLGQTLGQLLWPHPFDFFAAFLPSAGPLAVLGLAVLCVVLVGWKDRGAGAWLAACLALYASAFLAAWDPAAMVAQTDAARALYAPMALLLVAAAPAAASFAETCAAPLRRGAAAAAALLVVLGAAASVRSSLSLSSRAEDLARGRAASSYQAVDWLAAKGALTAEDAPLLATLAGDADPDQAVKLLDLASRLGGDVSSGRVNLALRLNSAGRSEEAIVQLEQAVKENPALAVARNDLGFFYMQHGRLKEAVEQLTQAVRLDPNLTLAQNNLATAESQLAGGLSPAQRQRRAVSLVDSSMRLLGRGDSAGAIQGLSEAQVTDPGNPVIPFDLGVVYVKSGQLQQAGAQFQRAVALNPNWGAAHFNMGFVLHQLGRLDEAVAQYREAIRCDPKASNAYLNAGVALTAMNKLDEADRFCSQAAKLDPGAASNPHCYRKR